MIEIFYLQIYLPIAIPIVAFVIAGSIGQLFIFRKVFGRWWRR